MDVDFGFIVFKRDITDERQHLDLLIYSNWTIIFGLPVEKPNLTRLNAPRRNRASKGEDPLCRLNVFAQRPASQAGR
jgi:hypothetical protein